MGDIFSVLEQDHREVKAMLDELERTAMPTPAVAGEEALTARGRLAEALVIEESKHEAVEEQYFWPAVRSHVDDGDALAEKAIAQESEGKHVLDKLRKAKAGTPEYESLIGEFISAAREHIGFEEQSVWPKLRAALSAEEASKLGEKFAAAKKMAPTRPHPHTPANPIVLKTAGLAAAMADRAVDALTGRGR